MRRIIEFVKKEILDTVVYSSLLLYLMLIIALIYKHYAIESEKHLMKSIGVLLIGGFLGLIIYILVKFLFNKLKQNDKKYPLVRRQSTNPG